MSWKENKNAYVKSYVMEEYHRLTVQIRKDNKSEMDSAIWNAIKDAPSKSKALKELAYKGLKK